MAKKPEQPERDSTAREVDRLLRQLPGADPSLTSDPDQPPPRPGEPRPPMGPRPPMPRPRPAAPPPPSRWGVWARVVGGVLLGIGLTQWPYASECGWPLYGYLAAVLALLLTAGWAAVTAWTVRDAAAHALALVVGFWGIVLAAEQILPRVGYAAETGYWRCSSIPAPPPPMLPAVPAMVPDSAAALDSVTADSAGPGGAIRAPGDTTVP